MSAREEAIRLAVADAMERVGTGDPEALLRALAEAVPDASLDELMTVLVQASAGLERKIEHDLDEQDLFADMIAVVEGFRPQAGEDEDMLAILRAAVAASHPPAVALVDRVGFDRIARSVKEARQMLDWMTPRPPAAETPPGMGAPPATEDPALKAPGEVVARMAAGELTPDEAAVMAGVVAAPRAVVEAQEFERRLVEVERRLQAAPQSPDPTAEDEA